VTSAGSFSRALALLTMVTACGSTPPGPASTEPAHPVAASPRDATPTSPGATTAGSSQPAPDDEPDAARERAPDLPRLALLEVPGFSPAVVSFPAKPRASEPLLVAVHGAGDGPDWQCATWRELLGERGVVLCPAGEPLGGAHGGFYHPDHHRLDALVTKTLESLREAFGERVDATRAIYAAYSQGATMGSHMIIEHARTFPRLVLVEGGFAEWNVPRGLEYRAAGGERVLFACGTKGCARKAARSVEWLEKAGLHARLESAPGAGHTYGGPVAERVAGALAWVLEGDDRW
jgi:predicted esterase